MKVHLYKVTKRRDHMITGTLCNRMSNKSEDGINSTGKPAEVTCKFCLRIMNQQAAT